MESEDSLRQSFKVINPKKRFVILLVAFLILVPLISAAPNYVISNSGDWRDVYSSILYANLKGIDSDFLVSTAHGPVLLDSISKSYDLLIISSKNNPLVFNYSALAESKGFNSVQERVVSSANLELVNDFPDMKSFIVVGDAYGYNSLAVVAYALATNSWVFLADRENIGDIYSILSKRTVDKLLLYGYVDLEVTDTLSKYNPEIINTGDKFSDNVEIVKKYSQVGSISQVLLSNGEFIEKEIMQGKNTLLLIGDENVPDVITNYIKSSNIQMGVLIGNELIGAATNIKQSTGINVQVKFARSARESTSGVSPVEGIDLFYITPLNVTTTNATPTSPVQEETPTTTTQETPAVDVNNTPISNNNNSNQNLVCNGCSLNNKCYPYGFRLNQNYCDSDSSNFINQSIPNSVCNNNFECDSNLCVNNSCVSGSLWQRIMTWFSHLFGGK
ncbi:MAG: hypothetical protein NTZ83_05910 [Candidatus Pacearchaeota archaeon]|nr:hypothetical protein [Candidatus Pacearchaeota archaeon]